MKENSMSYKTAKQETERLICEIEEMTITHRAYTAECLRRVLKENEELKRKNEELKVLYIRAAKHQEKIGHTELAGYMLAQIEAVPTFTTWEEYTTWVDKDKIREFIKNELPDDEIMKCCSNYDVNGVRLRKELQKLLEEK